MSSASTFCVGSTSTPRSSLNASPAPSDELGAVAVDEARTDGAGDLRPQLEAEALVRSRTGRRRGRTSAATGSADTTSRTTPRSSRSESSSCLGLRERRGEPRPGRGLAVDGLRVQVELRDAARPRVAESGVDRAVQLPPEAPPIGVINVTSDIWSGTSPSGVMTAIDRLGGRTQAAQVAEAVRRQHLDPARRDDADQLVPLQIQRAGIVGLELEPAAARAVRPRR